MVAAAFVSHLPCVIEQDRILIWGPVFYLALALLCMLVLISFIYFFFLIYYFYSFILFIAGRIYGSYTQLYLFSFFFSSDSLFLLSGLGRFIFCYMKQVFSYALNNTLILVWACFCTCSKFNDRSVIFSNIYKMYINLHSFNCRGLQVYVKSRKIFHYFHSLDCDILFLQETHSSCNDEGMWHSQWGNMHFLPLSPLINVV